MDATNARTQITKTRVACAFFGAMLLGSVILGVAVLVGGKFLSWVIGLSTVSLLILFGSMIRSKR